MSSNGNGNGLGWKIAGSLGGVLITIALVVSGFTYTKADAAATDVAALKAQYAGIQQRLDKLDGRLDRFDETLGEIKTGQTNTQYMVLFKDNPQMLRLLFPVAHP